MERIVLVGFPGAGKSTVGKALAHKMGLEFFDLDREIERFYHTSISDFLQKFDENFFRECENKMLKMLIQKDNIVLATGGGAPCFYNAMQQINRQAISVYLKLSKESLCVRLLQAKKDRPLINASTPDELRNYIEKTLEIREPIYEQAHIITKGESINVSSLVAVIRGGEN